MVVLDEVEKFKRMDGFRNDGESMLWGKCFWLDKFIIVRNILLPVDDDFDILLLLQVLEQGLWLFIQDLVHVGNHEKLLNILLESYLPQLVLHILRNEEILLGLLSEVEDEVDGYACDCDYYPEEEESREGEVVEVLLRKSSEEVEGDKDSDEWEVDEDEECSQQKHSDKVGVGQQV